MCCGKSGVSARTAASKHSSKQTVKVGATSKVGTVSTNNANTGCIKKYDELAQLDKKAIALHKKFRMVAEKGYRYAEIQKVIRGWIIALRTDCPDEDELKDFAEFINSEYAKYFQ